LLLANLEVRVPAFAFLGEDRAYGPIPTEAFAFFDAGVAWSSGEAPRFFGGTRSMARSWGAGLRINLLGFAIGEVSYVRPLDFGRRPEWRFVLSPGF
jgi:hypothetical protein